MRATLIGAIDHLMTMLVPLGTIEIDPIDDDTIGDVIARLNRSVTVCCAVEHVIAEFQLIDGQGDRSS